MFKTGPTWPKKCCGKKVTLTPKNNTQKCIIPHDILKFRPKILGIQKYQALYSANTAPILNT